ncbi:hypothetical protein CFC21_064304, partial [Triticum aestivum]
GN